MMTKSPFSRILLAGAAAGAMMGAGAAVADADDVRIGALMPMTGPLQAYGETSLNGVNLAIEQINESGGVLGGRMVEIVVADTQTNPQAGVEAAQSLISVEGVSAIIGALSSGVTIPVAQSITSDNEIPQISSASTSPVISTIDDDGYLFRTVPNDALQGVVLAREVEAADIGTVGIVYVNNDYGQGLNDAFVEEYEALGGTITSSEAYQEGGSSFRGELSAASSGDPEALVLIAYPEDGIPILRQALEGGFFDRFVMTDGMRSQSVVEAIGEDFLSDMIGTSPQAVEDSEGYQRFVEAYEDRFGELPTDPFMDTAYDAAFILGLAIEKAGVTDGPAIRDAIREVANPPGEVVLPGDFERARDLIADGSDINYEGAAGSQDFDNVGDVPGTYAVWTVQDGGIVNLRTVEPEME